MANVKIQAKENGPLIVEKDGQRVVALCRYGSSDNKPNCDGSHAKSDFKAEASEIDISE